MKEGKTGVYFENLDALRFVAAFMVVCAHFFTLSRMPNTAFKKYLGILLSFDGAGGDEGVSFFFVLSGFLITYLMFIEKQSAGAFNVGNFYVRRVLRIWPLYFLLLLIGFVIYPAINPTYRDEPASFWLYALFLANFDQIYLHGPQAEMLGVLWSVSVEEQFYLFWPLVFILAPGRRLLYVLMAAVAVSNIYRIDGGHKFHTITALSDLAIGAMAAYVSFYYFTPLLRLLSKLSRPLTVIVYFTGFCMLLLNFQLNKHMEYYKLVDRPLHALFFAFVIVDQNFSPNSPFKAGALPGLTHLGRISYGIYMLHAVAILVATYVAQQLGLNFYLNLMLAFALVYVFSTFSYYGFEKNFLDMKARFSKT